MGRKMKDSTVILIIDEEKRAGLQKHCHGFEKTSKLKRVKKEEAREKA
jgi:hypothetical protein